MIGEKTRRPCDNDPKHAEIASRCERSLAFLCKQFLGYADWDHGNYEPDQNKWGIHDWVEFVLKRPSKKKAILLPRGHLKSSLVTVGYTIQQILRNPNVRVLIANQIWDMSRKFLSEIKGHLEQSQLKYLFGDFQSQKWNQDDIVVRQRTRPLKEPTVMTTGVEAETTGGHFDMIILDDLTGLQNSATPEQREKTKRFRRSMINLLEPGGTLIEIGTRWHLDDTFQQIIEKEAKYYDIMVRQVVEKGKIIFPKKFSKKFDPKKKDWIDASAENCMDYIEHLKNSMPIDEFQAQYMNTPISVENQLFKQEFFKYWNKRPEGLYVGMGVDLAISQRTEADYTALVVVGMDKDWNLYILDYLRGHWTPSQIVEKVFEMQARWQPYAVSMEINGFQRTLKLAVEEEMRRRGQYFGIEEVRNGPDRSTGISGGKEGRIKALEPFYRRGAVYHAAWMKGRDFEMELLTFPKGRHDDIVDAAVQIMPFLGAGVEQPLPDMKPGTYEYEVREAHRFLGRGNFFDHGH